MNKPKLMIYGATGYTGRLVVAETVEAGLRPVLAGRDAEKLAGMDGSRGPGARREPKQEVLETRAFGLDDADRVAAALRDIHVVLHCAGPFSRTALPMFEACLVTGTHYVDITGEIAVFESLAARDAEARAAGIMVLPGAGFDVVPTDCLIADLAERHPGGRIVRLGIAARTGVSRGTMRTVVENLTGFRIRRNGVITRVAPGSMRHEFDFGHGPTEALVSFLADVSTAWWSTGIPNIEAYSRAGKRTRRLMRLGRWAGGLLAGRTAQALLNKLVDRRPPGPTEAERRTSDVVMVAEIEDSKGQRAVARMRVPDPYGFTAVTLVAIGARILAGEFRVGYQTPSSAYGAGFVREFDGVEW